MDDVLYLKFRQHGELRTLLLDTYPTDLVYARSGDPFWGDGAGAGMNELGKSLMRVRERLRFEGKHSRLATVNQSTNDEKKDDTLDGHFP